ncbi:DUF2300 domain-containing protein [Rhodanobacter sp. L36]|uniref:DUF2300 domain-containing protein n=1 Tax=Rhodanobacter sp. L36 TaxID=1747221 RepID=UPI00131D9786|nr:DUF2300 domain-containing protein [Rhodanobacter sp. L36]
MNQRRPWHALAAAAFAWLAIGSPVASAEYSAPLQFAWQPRGTDAQLWHLDDRPLDASTARPLPADLDTPLGSVWKLFVYSYLVDRRMHSDDYHCGDDHSSLTTVERKRIGDEEIYCCHAGGRIDRERALVQSCGLYFEPQRLQLDTTVWRDYWRKRHAPLWLQSLAQIKSTTRVSVADLLAALRSVPEDARTEAEHTLISVITLGRGEGTLADYGSLLRAKTWTMPDPLRRGASLGGAAGWLADGTPIWMSGPGSSNRVLAAAASHLHPLLQTVPVADSDACVVVDYFDRYPIHHVLPAQGHQPVRDGALNGRFRVEFVNGHWIDIESHGEMQLRGAAGDPHLSARLGLNDYIARVVEREGDASESAAAEALAVAARSYLVQQASLDRGCWHIADASRTQRVAAHPPSAAARQVAAWTDTLILTDVSVQYHGTLPGKDRMAWRDAVQLSKQGLSFDAILARSWPGATLTSLMSPLGGDCQPIALAQSWLQHQTPQWQQRLRDEPGYETPAIPAVCQLREGRPYADARRNRLYVSGLSSEEDRIALAHEYLHLAFAHHPRGEDEVFIEQQARRLLRTPVALPDAVPDEHQGNTP